MGLPADWSFMDQKTHFSFVLEGPEIILLTTSMPAQIKHQPLSLLRTPVCESFPFLLVHTAEVKSTKKPSISTFHTYVADGLLCIFLAQMRHWPCLNTIPSVSSLGHSHWGSCILFSVLRWSAEPSGSSVGRLAQTVSWDSRDCSGHPCPSNGIRQCTWVWKVAETLMCSQRLLRWGIFQLEETKALCFHLPEWCQRATL